MAQRLPTGEAVRFGVEAPETERVWVPEPQPLPIPQPHPDPEPEPAQPAAGL